MKLTDYLRNLSDHKLKRVAEWIGKELDRRRLDATLDNIQLQEIKARENET